MRVFATITGVLSLASAADAFAAPDDPPTCEKNPCLQKVRQNKKQGGNLGCTAFFRTTVIPPATIIKVTSTATITGTTTIVTSQTTTTQTTSPSTTTTDSFVTSIETDATTTSVSAPPASGTVFPPPPPNRRVRRGPDRAKPTTTSMTVVPPYASSVCPNTSAYSSACSCIGATHGTTTLPTPTRTSTVTARRTVIVATNSQTTVVKTDTTTVTSVTIETSISTVTTSTTTKLAYSTGPASAQCTDIVAPESDGTLRAYYAYYSGSGYTKDNTLDRQFSEHLPISTLFADPGPEDPCDAIQKCANLAAPDDGVYWSFDAYYLQSEAMWNCTQYFESDGDPSYFTIQNPDVSQAYAYYNN